MAKQSKQTVAVEAETENPLKEQTVAVEKNAVVIKPFSDILDFSVKYHPGQFVNHFDEVRLKGAIEKGLVELK